MDNDILSDEDIKNALTELKDTLQGFLGDRMVKIVLYGSRARGDYEGDSDVDIAIIVRGLTRELKNRILTVVADIELKYLVPISILVFSEEDVDFLKKRERRIIADIEKEGIPL